MTDLEISRAWLVDPTAGREGPGEIVVRDGVLTAVTWLSGAEADGVDAAGVIVAPGFIDLHTHLREPGDEDAETVASRRSALSPPPPPHAPRRGGAPWSVAPGGRPGRRWSSSPTGR